MSLNCLSFRLSRSSSTRLYTSASESRPNSARMASRTTQGGGRPIIQLRWSSVRRAGRATARPWTSSRCRKTARCQASRDMLSAPACSKKSLNSSIVSSSMSSAPGMKMGSTDDPPPAGRTTCSSARPPSVDRTWVGLNLFRGSWGHSGPGHPYSRSQACVGWRWI